MSVQTPAGTPILSLPPYGIARREDLLAAFRGSLAPVKPATAYKLALACAALAMLVLPLVYLGLIGSLAYGIHWYAGAVQLPKSPTSWDWLARYVPLTVGSIVIFFLVKPLLAPRANGPKVRSVSREQEPLLHDFVHRICILVGAPMPSRIDLDCEINASASLRRGWLSLFGKPDLVLTVGLPLVDAFTLEQLAGVLAHEFGHFAQGAGMRLSYLVRSTNFWLARVAYGRDSWDEYLEIAGKITAWWLALIVAVLRGMVWAARQLLALLMHAGHAISCYLMRQMEFDADRYEVGLVGPRVFAETCHELRCLTTAHRRSLGELRETWKRGELTDSLPRRVTRIRQTLDARQLARIAAEIRRSRSDWSDTHPADSERIEAARRELGKPVFSSPLPAQVLFRDFPTLAREMSKSFYEHHLETNIDAAALLPVDDFAAGQDRERQEREALPRLLRIPFDLFTLPDFPPAHSGEEPRATAEVLARQLAAARDAQLANAAQLRRTAAEISRFTAEDMDLSGGEILLQLGVRFLPGAFGLTDESAAGFGIRRQVLESRLAELRQRLEPGFGAIAARSNAALALLALADWAAAAGMADAGREIASLLPAARALEKQRRRLLGLRGELCKIRMIGGALQRGLNPETALKQMEQIGAGMAYELAGLSHVLRSVAFPFRHARGQIDLGLVLVPAVPSREAKEPAEAVGAAKVALEQAQLTLGRIWGRLAAVVEQVEQQLDLHPLEGVPGESTEEDAAASSAKATWC